MLMVPIGAVISEVRERKAAESCRIHAKTTVAESRQGIKEG